METQIPAQGILLMGDWGPSKMYKAVCSCGHDDCSHLIDVEADDHAVAVTIYTKQRSTWWQLNRWQQLWNILIKGHFEFEATIVLDKQVALNYASVLQSAIKDVEEFQKERDEQIKSS